MPQSKKYPCCCLTVVKGRKCVGRRSLNRKPSEYIRQPACPHCHQRHWYIHTYRMRKEMGSNPTCMCGGHHYPHRKGSKYCEHHPRYEQDCAGRAGKPDNREFTPISVPFFPMDLDEYFDFKEGRLA